MLNVYLPAIYGEGKEHALLRLREEVAKRRGINNIPDQGPHPAAVLPFGRDPDFIERSDILDLLDQKCIRPGSRIALVGLGGIGKSQLAIEYAYRTQHRSPNAWVFWVYASNAARFELSFRDIANYIQLPGRQVKDADVFQLVYDWLRDERRKWMIILDNADNPHFLFTTRGNLVGQSIGKNDKYTQSLVSYLPQCPNGSILMTARSKDAARKLVEDRDILVVEPMVKEEAVMLLQKKLAVHDNAESLGDLATALEYMPLAIVQAAAYINRRGPQYSVQQYLSCFQENDRKKESLLNREGGQLRRDKDAKNSVITTWQISFEHIREMRPSAADLLSLMCFFDRQGIPGLLLRTDQPEAPEDTGKIDTEEKADDNDEENDNDETSLSGSIMTDEEDEFQEDIITLREYSFISESEDGKTFEIHRLIQLATRKWLTENNQDQKWEGRFLKNLDTAFPNGEHKNWPKCQLLFPHVIAAAARKPKVLTHLQHWSSILYKGAWYTWRLGNGIQTETFARESMKVRKKVFGDEDDKTLRSMGLVGYGLNLQGRWDKAEKLFIQIMETNEKKLGEDHPDTLTNKANLALTYSKQGRWEAAEELFVQVMETRKRKLGEDHPDTLTSIANLASTFWNQGRWEAAERLEVQVMETSKKKLGEDHPDTLTSIANLASTFWNQGRWEAAEELFVQVIETSKKKLGEDHPDTLTSITNLASTFWNQGRWEAAERLEVQVMETRKKKLGEDHPDTLTSMNNLAVTWKALGKYEEAKRLMQECIRLRFIKIGPYHPFTISSSETLASWEIDSTGNSSQSAPVIE
ncbi:hypothetical protein BX600DRAFT_388594 [Xylariales sp. PMI_506]|nr:hypothetical protein BX600DRAFT_388594 [Xylariales sp. PMI_506]